MNERLIVRINRSRSILKRCVLMEIGKRSTPDRIKKRTQFSTHGFRIDYSGKFHETRFQSGIEGCMVAALQRILIGVLLPFTAVALLHIGIEGRFLRPESNSS